MTQIGETAGRSVFQKRGGERNRSLLAEKRAAEFKSWLLDAQKT